MLCQFMYRFFLRAEKRIDDYGRWGRCSKRKVWGYICALRNINIGKERIRMLLLYSY